MVSKITPSKTKAIKIGNTYIGANYPIAIQSMTKTKTSDIEKTARQLKDLEKVGCEIVRLAIKDTSDAQAIKKIKQTTQLPLIGDIHFNFQLALEAIDNGVDKIRLNPGNIYKKGELKEIVYAAKQANIPIRVGVNSGSLIKIKKSLPAGRQEKSKIKNTADIMVKGALAYLKILEGFKFYNIVISLKASDIFDTIAAYRKISKLCDYPLHLGVTATGPSYIGAIKSSIALSSLLLEGIGDTIRVSLTDEPVQEVKVAKIILEALGLRNFGPRIISCPTCGRCEVDLVSLVNEFEERLKTVNCKLLTVNSQPLRVALMGCVVNGPGEAQEADLGVAFGKQEGLLFKHGKAIKKVTFSDCLDSLWEEVLSQDE